MEFYGNQQPTSGGFLGFYQINSGVDDVEEFAGRVRQHSFFGSNESDIDAVYRVEEHDLVLDQAEKFYLRLGNLTSDDDEDRIAGYLRLEKVV